LIFSINIIQSIGINRNKSCSMTKNPWDQKIVIKKIILKQIGKFQSKNQQFKEDSNDIQSQIEYPASNNATFSRLTQKKMVHFLCHRKKKQNYQSFWN
jgi:hypothetical protein